MLEIRRAGDRGHAQQHDARALQRIAFLALVEQQRHPWIGKDVLSVDGQT